MPAEASAAGSGFELIREHGHSFFVILSDVRRQPNESKDRMPLAASLARKIFYHIVGCDGASRLTGPQNNGTARRKVIANQF